MGLCLLERRQITMLLAPLQCLQDQHVQRSLRSSIRFWQPALSFAIGCRQSTCIAINGARMAQYSRRQTSTKVDPGEPVLICASQTMRSGGCEVPMDGGDLNSPHRCCGGLMAFVARMQIALAAEHRKPVNLAQICTCAALYTCVQQ